MSGRVIEIRGHRILVEAKSGSQLAYIKYLYERQSDEHLAKCAAETKSRVDKAYPPVV